jgi:hypothetical protein
VADAISPALIIAELPHYAISALAGCRVGDISGSGRENLQDRAGGHQGSGISGM